MFITECSDSYYQALQRMDSSTNSFVDQNSYDVLFSLQRANMTDSFEKFKKCVPRYDEVLEQVPF